MAELAQDLDLFVFPSHGEGYGLPPREAMLVGVPTIISNSSGMKEMSNPRYNWTVPITGKEETPLGGEWDVPDWDHFCDMLKWHYSHREAARRKAMKGADWLWGIRSPEAVAIMIASHLEQIDPFHGEARKKVKSWDEMYSKPITDPELQHLLTHHEKFFAMVSARTPAGGKLIEIGVGSGATTYGFSLMDARVSVLDINAEVLRHAREAFETRGLAHKIQWLVADAYKLDKLRLKYDVAVSQGFFEHFSDADIHKLIQQQLAIASKVMFSVPSVHYPAHDVGDERLLSLEDWRRILKDYVVTHLTYYGGDTGKYHVFACVEGLDPGIRGSSIRIRG